MKLDESHSLSVVIVSLLLGIFALGTLPDLYINDEAAFVRVATGIAATGTPSVVWHPPTYVYYLALSGSLFGFTELTVRGATFLFTLLTVPLVYALGALLVRTAAGDDVDPSWKRRGWEFPTACAGLYAISPLVIQNGTLVDIDGGLLALVTTAFLVWFVWAFEASRFSTRVRYPGLALGFALVSWVKFGALPALFVSVLVYLVLSRQYRTAGLAGASMVLGAVGFAVSWLAVATIGGLSFVEPFAHNFGRMFYQHGVESAATDPTRRVLQSGWTLFFEVLWISPFLLALAYARFVPNSGLRNFLEGLRQRDPSVALALFAGATILQYVVLAKLPFRFPKYMGPVMPVLVVLAALTAAKWIPAPSSMPEKSQISVIAIAVLAVIVFLLPDPFLSPHNQPVVTSVLYAVRVGIQYALIVTLVVVGVLLARRRTSESVLNEPRRAIVIVLVVLLLGTNVGLVATQLSAEYETRYFYGSQGVDRVVGFAEVEHDLLCASAKHSFAAPEGVSFYADTQSPKLWVKYYAKDLSRIEGTPPSLLILNRFYESRFQPVEEAMRDDSRYQRTEIGSFVVYKRTNLTCSDE